MHSAVAQNQEKDENLHRPEMRPHDFGQQLCVASGETARLPPKIDKSLQVMDDARYHQVDHRLPCHVVSKRFIRIAIDCRYHVRDQHRLAENQGSHCNGRRREGLEMRALGDQNADKRDNVQRNEKEDRRWEHRKEFLFELRR